MKTLRRLFCCSGILLLAAAGSSASGDEEKAPQKPNPYDQLSLEQLLHFRVVTASQQDESLREAPVPVTVITSDMIRAIGARTLQDVLITYVPGMTFVVDHNEMNVAMRGIYASSQQKILVMLDGHRLNSRAYSEANPDYSIRIDLDKVKQIEVLRGPGSSLYGNVALTAVVNIVTKPGSEIDGMVVSLGGGEFVSGSDSASDGPFAAGRSLSLTYGKEFKEGNDLVLWGGIFRAEGERIPTSKAEDFSPNPKDGYAIVGGIRDPASYDLGLRYRAGSFTVLGNARYGKLTEPFSAGGMTGEVYDYDAYRTFRGTGPGLGSRSNHFEVKYAPALSKAVSLEVSGYYDDNEIGGTTISDPAKGSYLFVNWMDSALGGIGQLRWSYDSKKLGQGAWLVGLQVDRMQLTDSGLPAGQAGDWARFGDTNQKRLLQTGQEVIYSGFTQLKHSFSERWIVNAGFRLDVKDRHHGPHVTDLSPRVGVVWIPSKRLDVKLSYGQSFVDAPYWYRYNSLPSYQGSEGLRPEHLKSLQLTPTVSLRDGRLRNALNVFYNDVSDFVFRNNKAGANDPKYVNAGALRSAGVENELAWIRDAYRVRGTFTFQHVLTSRDIGARGGEIFNVPGVVASLALDAKAFGRAPNATWLNLTLRYVGEQLAPIAPTFKLTPDNTVARFEDPENRIGQYVLVNLGFRAPKLYFAGVGLDATVYNLLDKRYDQGGSVVHPYPQAGRSFMVSLTYRTGHGSSGLAQ